MSEYLSISSKRIQEPIQQSSECLPSPEQSQQWLLSVSPCRIGNPQMSPPVQMAILHPADERQTGLLTGLLVL